MRALSASQLLDVWEQGLGQQSAQRALTLLSAASPQTPLDILAERSIGRRDAALLTLREWTFGSILASVATCPACSERLEFTFNVADILVSPDSEPAGELSLSAADYDLRFRLPLSEGAQDVHLQGEVVRQVEEERGSYLISGMGVRFVGSEVSMRHKVEQFICSRLAAAV